MLTPIIKYPGGKTRELPVILANLPKKIKHYYEPFVGAGAVYFAICNKISKKLINDKSSDLINLYLIIRKQDPDFYRLVNQMINNWQKADFTAHKAIPYLWQKLQTTDTVQTDTAFNYPVVKGKLANNFANSDKFNSFLLPCIKRKFNYSLKQKARKFTQTDFTAIMTTSYKSAVYMYYRDLYNCQQTITQGRRAGLYLFLRQYAYNSMFRFSRAGNFNVPYGGQSYNNISLQTKLDYYQSSELIKALTETTITNLDFSDFLAKYPPEKDDFLFIDPPYDSAFSQYDQLPFDEIAQTKLATILIEEIVANWMVVISDTPLIRRLYPIGMKTANDNKIKIQDYNKVYNTNFKNRNQRKTKLLLITNY